MAVVSSLVYTVKDDGGNRRTHGWFLYELTSNYIAGGLQTDLSTYFRRIDQYHAEPASGTLSSLAFVKQNEADFPGDPSSGRLQIYTMTSTGSGLIGYATEVVSGAAVSGTRARIHALGY